MAIEEAKTTSDFVEVAVLELNQICGIVAKDDIRSRAEKDDSKQTVESQMAESATPETVSGDVIIDKVASSLWNPTVEIGEAESDAWSFGFTLVEMCTGAILWAGLSSEEIYRTVIKARRQQPQYVIVVGVGIPRELWKMYGKLGGDGLVSSLPTTTNTKCPELLDPTHHLVSFCLLGSEHRLQNDHSVTTLN